MTPHNGEQSGQRGGERVIVFEAQAGPVAMFHHMDDDSPGAPCGEKWTTHRNSSGVVDSYHRFTNDGPTAGDGLGGVLSNGGALHQTSTGGGHRLRMDDTAKKVTLESAGGLASTYDDTVDQIKHAAGSVYVLYDGAGNAISHVANVVSLGDLHSNLAAANQAYRNSDGVAFAKSVQKMVGNALQQAAQAAIAAGMTNASTWLATIQAGLPSPSFTDLTSSIAALSAPSGSPTVLIK